MSPGHVHHVQKVVFIFPNRITCCKRTWQVSKYLKKKTSVTAQLTVQNDRTLSINTNF